MRVLFCSLVTACLVFCVSAQLFADRISLKNGDALTGTIVRMEEGILVFETAYAGTLKIQWEQIDQIEVASSLKVVLADQTTLIGESKATKTGQMKLKMGAIVETASFNLKQVQAINPPPPETRKVTLHGGINVGFSGTSGNTDTESQHIDAEVVARTEQNRYTAGVEYNREKDEDELTTKNYLGYAKYDHFLSQKWYAYAHTLFEKDEFEDLNLRSTIGLGMGYQFFESEQMNLYLEAGPSYLNEDYETGEDSDTLSGRWALLFDRYLYKDWVQFFHFQEGYQGLEETDNFVFRSKTGLRFPLGERMRSTIQYNFDWNGNPPPDTEEKDTKYIITLGYAF